VTAGYPTPTWGDVDAFCKADGWVEVRTTDHVHWEKTLQSGEVLRTHRSLAADKAIGPNLFALILREQLNVNKVEFWAAVDTGEPVDRPVDPLEEAPPEYALWVVMGLAKFGIYEDEVRKMTPQAAEALLQQKWAGG
jgi:hypothetical protein